VEGTEGIDADEELSAAPTHMHAHVGGVAIDVGARASLRAQAIDDRVLRALREVAGVVLARRTLGREVDEERALGRDVLLPRQRAHDVVERVGILDAVTLVEEHHRAARDARVQRDAVELGDAAFDDAGALPRVEHVQPERAQLVVEDGFGSGGASEAKSRGHAG